MSVLLELLAQDPGVRNNPVAGSSHDSGIIGWCLVITVFWALAVVISLALDLLPLRRLRRPRRRLPADVPRLDPETVEPLDPSAAPPVALELRIDATTVPRPRRRSPHRKPERHDHEVIWTAAACALALIALYTTIQAGNDPIAVFGARAIVDHESLELQFALSLFVIFAALFFATPLIDRWRRKQPDRRPARA